MALVRFGSLVQAASGALGALVFSRQAGAAIARMRPILKPHDSPAVLANQCIFAQARAAWAALSAADRLTWIRAAPQFPSVNRLGVSRPLSPFVLFMRLAIRNLLLGFAPPTFPYPFGNADLGHELSIEPFPGGPINLINPPPHIDQVPRHTTKAQRLFSTHPGFPGQLWTTISRDQPANYSINLWPQLTAVLGTPARLEWFRFLVTQWVTGWPRSVTSSHLVQIPNVGDELLTNGDFQIGGTPPSGWTVTGGGALTQIAAATWGDGKSGRWIVGAANPQTQWFTATAKRFSLVAAAAYTIRFAYKVISGNISHIRYAGSGLAEQTLCNALPDTSGAWVTTSIAFTPPSSASGCYLIVRNLINIPCDVFFDNIYIRKDLY
jgi:hypothetical protein